MAATEPSPLLELEVGAIATGGGCVAHVPDGRVAFVRHCLPGERVLARITSLGASFVRADALEILHSSEDRVSPPCPHAGPGHCGGCDFQHVSVAGQRRLKAALVAEQLRRIARVDHEVTVEPVAGDHEGLGWRTRVRVGLDAEGRPGFRRHRSHELELVSGCPIAHPGVLATGALGRTWEGLDELEVVATDGGDALIAASGPKRADPALPEGATGFVVNGQVRQPPGAVHVTVDGYRFRVSAGVFWQVHAGAAAALAGCGSKERVCQGSPENVVVVPSTSNASLPTARALAPDVAGGFWLVHAGAAAALAGAVRDARGARAGDHVIDLYAGAGLFSVLAADVVGRSGSVLAVERNARACTDARHNARHAPHVQVRRSSVTPTLVSQGLGEPDLVVLDPSREGAGRAVSAALAGLRPAPRRIVYVACDPSSFSRDLRVLLDAGWALESLRAFDIFPMTEHIELVAALVPAD